MNFVRFLIAWGIWNMIIYTAKRWCLILKAPGTVKHWIFCYNYIPTTSLDVLYATLWVPRATRAKLPELDDLWGGGSETRSSHTRISISAPDTYKTRLLIQFQSRHIVSRQLIEVVGCWNWQLGALRQITKRSVQTFGRWSWQIMDRMSPNKNTDIQ